MIGFQAAVIGLWASLEVKCGIIAKLPGSLYDLQELKRPATTLNRHVKSPR